MFHKVSHGAGRRRQTNTLLAGRPSFLDRHLHTTARISPSGWTKLSRLTADLPTCRLACRPQCAVNLLTLPVSFVSITTLSYVEWSAKIGNCISRAESYACQVEGVFPVSTSSDGMDGSWRSADGEKGGERRWLCSNLRTKACAEIKRFDSLSQGLNKYLHRQPEGQALPFKEDISSCGQ